jgi:hypothetical protein
MTDHLIALRNIFVPVFLVMGVFVLGHFFPNVVGWAAVVALVFLAWAMLGFLVWVLFVKYINYVNTISERRAREQRNRDAMAAWIKGQTEELNEWEKAHAELMVKAAQMQKDYNERHNN